MTEDKNELSVLKGYCSLFENPEEHRKKIRTWTTIIVLGSFIAFAVVWSLAVKEQISLKNALGISFALGIIIGGGAFWRYSGEQLKILTKYFEPKKELIESRITELTETIRVISDKEEAPPNIADELMKLEELRKSGVLTEEEFEKAKKRLLN